MRRNAKPLLIFLAVLIGCVGCDHVSKQVAISTLTRSEAVPVVGDMLALHLTSNPGAFLSLGASLPEGVRRVVFLGIAPLLTLFLCGYLMRSGRASRLVLVGLGLLAGGGLANWLDRLLHGGAVTDFLILGFGPLRTGIFNIADIAVVAGAALVLFARSREVPSRKQVA